MELRKRTEKSTNYNEETEGGYSSDSSSCSDDLPLISYHLPSFHTKQKSRKSIQELLDEHQSLIEDIKDDNISYKNVEQKFKQLEIEPHQDSEVRVSTPEEVPEKKFHIFCVNDLLQFFNTSEATPSQCGYENLNSNLTLLEDELLGFKRVELEYVLSGFLRTCHPYCLSDLKSFVTYILRNLVSNDRTAVKASYRLLLSILRRHEDAKNLPFTSAEIFMLLFNFGTDVDNCELLMKLPAVQKQVKVTKLPINLNKVPNRLPYKWLYNLKITLKAVEALLPVCNIKPEDMCHIVLFFLWMTLDFSLIEENLVHLIRSCINTAFLRLKKENWEVLMVDIAKILVSVEFSSGKDKWKHIYDMTEVIPCTKQGAYLKKQISFQALQHICFDDTEESGIGLTDKEFNLEKFITVLLKSVELDSKALSVALKFIDLSMRYLKPEEKQQEELCNVLKKCSALRDHEVTYFGKIRAKLRIKRGKDLVIKASMLNESDICHKIKKEEDSQIQSDNTFDCKIKMEEGNKFDDTEKIEMKHPGSFTVYKKNIDYAVHKDLVSNSGVSSIRNFDSDFKSNISSDISVENVFSVENFGTDSSGICTEDPNVSCNGPVIEHVESMFVPLENGNSVNSLVIDGHTNSNIDITNKTEVHRASDTSVVVKVEYDSEEVKNDGSSDLRNSDLTISSNAAAYHLLSSQQTSGPKVNLPPENFVLVEASSSKSDYMTNNSVFAINNAVDNLSDNISNADNFVKHSDAEKLIIKPDLSYNLAPIVVDSISIATEETGGSEMQYNLSPFNESCTMNKAPFENDGFASIASESHAVSVLPSDLPEMNGHLNISNSQSSVTEPELELIPRTFIHQNSNNSVGNNLVFTDNAHCVSTNLESNLNENGVINEDIIFIKETQPQKKTEKLKKGIPGKFQPKQHEAVEKEPEIIFLKKATSPLKSANKLPVISSRNVPKSGSPTYYTNIQNGKRDGDDIVFIKEVQSSHKKSNKSKSAKHSSSPSSSKTSSNDPYLHNLSQSKGITLIQQEGNSSKILSSNTKEISGNSGTLNVHFDNISKDNILLLQKVGTTVTSNQPKNSSDIFNDSSKIKTIVLDLPLKKGIDFNNLQDASLLTSAASRSKPESPSNEKEKESLVIEIEEIDCDQVTSVSENENIDAVDNDKSNSAEDLPNETSLIHSIIVELLENVDHILSTEESKQTNMSSDLDTSAFKNLSEEINKDISVNSKSISDDENDRCISSDENEKLKINNDMMENATELKSQINSQNFTDRSQFQLTNKLKSSDVVNPEVILHLKSMMELFPNTIETHSCKPHETSEVSSVPDSLFCDVSNSVVSTVSSILDDVDKSSSFSPYFNIPSTSSVKSNFEHTVKPEDDTSKQLLEVKIPTVIPSDTVNDIKSGHSETKYTFKSGAAVKVSRNKTATFKGKKHDNKRCGSFNKSPPLQKKFRLSSNLYSPGNEKDSSGSCATLNSAKTNSPGNEKDSSGSCATLNSSKTNSPGNEKDSSGSCATWNSSKANIFSKVIDSKAQKFQKRKKSESSGSSQKFLKLVTNPEKCKVVNSSLISHIKYVKSPPKHYSTQLKRKMYSPKKSVWYSPKCLLKYSSKKDVKSLPNRSPFLKSKIKAVNNSEQNKSPPTNQPSTAPSSEFYVSLSSDSDVEELYSDPSKYKDLECMIIYESIEQIVVD